MKHGEEIQVVYEKRMSIVWWWCCILSGCCGEMLAQRVVRMFQRDCEWCLQVWIDIQYNGGMDKITKLTPCDWKSASSTSLSLTLRSQFPFLQAYPSCSCHRQPHPLNFPVWFWFPGCWYYGVAFLIALRKCYYQSLQYLDPGWDAHQTEPKTPRNYQLSRTRWRQDWCSIWWCRWCRNVITWWFECGSGSTTWRVY